MSLYALESNPEVMNKFLLLMGVPEKWALSDVLGLDNESLAWVPRPCVGLMLLYPCDDQQIKAAEANAAKDAEKDMHPDLFHMKQTVSNACGTIALIHLVANNIEELELKDGPFKKLLKKAQHLSSEERANILQDPIFQDDVMSLLNTHQELAMEGQTDARTESSHHFVALVQNNGKLYELDGRKPCPISHGPTSSEKFVEDAAAVCRKFISNKPNDVKFSVMALTVADNL